MIIAETLRILNSIDPVDLIKAARKSPSLFPLYLTLSNGKKVTVWQNLEELDGLIREAVLALEESNLSLVSDEIKELITKYKQRYQIINSYQLPTLSLTNSPTPNTKFIIGRNMHRQALTDIIKSAEEFLAIASFRLEDKTIIDLISEKAKILPKGVWILTDLGNEVLDRIDTDMQGKIDHEEDYAESDRKKRECLRTLAESGAFIRSGLFHVKFCLTEQQAYLGSCNLTGGSLERNGEAGIIWQQTEKHYQLFEYFQDLWSAKTTAEIISSIQGVRSINLTNQTSITSVNGFLSYFDYKNDLESSLTEFAKHPDGEVYIYGRSIRPSFKQRQILANLNSKIFYGWNNFSGLKAYLIRNLHAKVVILGKQVAYIGSQDLSVSRNPNHDLTYKTIDTEEIKLIKQLVENLHPN